ADVTTVPVGALFRSGDTWGVFAIAGGRAEQRRVKVGGRSAIDAWIEEGIVPGEQVIVYPSDRLADGRSVAIVRRAQ
ncbi:MAG: efflux transporter periplasmic adaptor subunit, partial [Burkholderiales bacterium]